MNDPHVQALIYVVEHDRSVDYADASPVEVHRCDFTVMVEEGHARITLNRHFASVQEARDAVQPFIDQWEFDASLAAGRSKFRLRFERPEMIDRQPMPGVVSIAAHISSGVATLSASVTVSREYPAPPAEFTMDVSNPDVRTMHDRYTGYIEGHEPLPAMAYFCYEVFTQRLSKGQKDASDTYKISTRLLREFAKIASTKGGSTARKASGIGHELSAHETQVLRKGIQLMIRRAAIIAGDPNQHLPVVDFSKLLES